MSVMRPPSHSRSPFVNRTRPIRGNKSSVLLRERDPEPDYRNTKRSPSAISSDTSSRQRSSNNSSNIESPHASQQSLCKAAPDQKWKEKRSKDRWSDITHNSEVGKFRIDESSPRSSSSEYDINENAEQERQTKAACQSRYRSRTKRRKRTRIKSSRSASSRETETRRNVAVKRKCSRSAVRSGSLSSSATCSTKTLRNHAVRRKHSRSATPPAAVVKCSSSSTSEQNIKESFRMYSHSSGSDVSSRYRVTPCPKDKYSDSRSCSARARCRRHRSHCRKRSNVSNYTRGFNKARDSKSRSSSSPSCCSNRERSIVQSPFRSRRCKKKFSRVRENDNFCKDTNKSDRSDVSRCRNNTRTSRIRCSRRRCSKRRCSKRRCSRRRCSRRSHSGRRCSRKRRLTERCRKKSRCKRLKCSCTPQTRKHCRHRSRRNFSLCLIM